MSGRRQGAASDAGAGAAGSKAASSSASAAAASRKQKRHPLDETITLVDGMEEPVDLGAELLKEAGGGRSSSSSSTGTRNTSARQTPSPVPSSNTTKTSSSAPRRLSTSTSTSLAGSPHAAAGAGSGARASAGGREDVLSTLLGPEYTPPQTADDVARTTFLRKKKKRFEISPQHAPGEAYHATIAKLKALYKGKIQALEEKYLFQRFGFEELTDQQLEAKAQVLLLGQYSTGKTTMIRYLLGQEYMGLHVGPEPTTDRYVAIVHGDTDDVIQGKVLTENPTLPFKETEGFAGLAGKFQAARCPAEVLKSLTLIDTPGVLSGEKQKAREYDFRAVTKWFALRSDLILLLFDPSKLDISDELKQVIGDLKPCGSKVRIVLNKADTLDRCALTRVYGALMWAMGKILETPEVVRVFIGSFWEKPLKYSDPLFVEDEASLMKELENLPHNVPKQRINNLADRVGVLKFYLHLMAAVRARLSILPIGFVQEAVRQSVLDSLPQIVEEVLLRQRKKLAHKDVPPMAEIRAHLASFKSLHELPRPTTQDLQRVDALLEQDIPRLIAEVEDTYAALHHGHGHGHHAHAGGNSRAALAPGPLSPKGKAKSPLPSAFATGATNPLMSALGSALSGSKPLGGVVLPLLLLLLALAAVGGLAAVVLRLGAVGAGQVEEGGHWE